MATGNTGTTDPSLSGNTDTARDLAESTRRARREGNDFRDVLKDSEQILRKMVKSYDTIEGQLETLSKSSINIKEINKAIEKVNRDQYNIQKKIKEFEGDTSTQRTRAFSQYKQQLDLIKSFEEDALRYKEAGDDAGYRAAKDLIEQTKTRQDQIYDILSAEEQAYLNNLESFNLTEKQIQYGKQKLEQEKKIADKVGLTGSILKNLGKVLPRAKTAYEKIVEETRKGESTTKAWVLTSTLLVGAIVLASKTFDKFIKGPMNSITGSGGPLSKLVSPFTELISKIPVIGGLLGGIADLGANLVDFATGANSETQKFARNLGISYGTAKQLTDEYDSIARNTGAAYLNIEKFRKSQTELSSALGINNILNHEILASDIQLAEQAGIELDTRKDLASVAMIQRKTQTQIFAAVAAQTKMLSNSLGVNIRLQDTIKKAASFGGVLGLTFAKYPEKLTKALLVTKALGMDLQKLDSIANSFLDFESSIANEFEAQLLTGKNINLQKARELALSGDLAGLAVEINKQLGSSQEFLDMNRLQQESIAQALGLGRDELADMLKQQTLFAAVGANTEKQFKEKITLMKQQGTLQSEFLSKLSEEQAQLFLNSTATESIANFVDKLKQSFANLINNPTFKDFVDKIMTALSDPNFINNIVDKLAAFSDWMVKITSQLLRGIGYTIHLADYLSLGAIPNEVPETLVSMGENLSGVSIGGNVLRTQSSGGAQSGGGKQTGGTGPNIVVNVESFIKEHYKDANVRFQMAPKETSTSNVLGGGG